VTEAAARPVVATWMRVAVNYVVPFAVSSIGYLAPSTRAPAQP
jgi:hypothetical protein